MIFILARALIPSWRFFDRVGTELSLEYRNSEGDEWKNALPSPAENSFPLFVNTKRNTHIACHSILERFVEEARGIATPAETYDLVSHGLLRNMVRKIARSNGARFRIIASNQGSADEQIYVSDPIGND